MNDFSFYFLIGWHHIIDIGALDHILFIMALSAIYLLGNWKQVLILVTAFTIGHSLTLVLSAYDVIRLNEKWVEFLVPCTIIATAASNFFVKDFSGGSFLLNYFLALFFGMVHGLGFANSIRFMLAKDEKIAVPLLGFNTGLEAGQIAMVTIILCFSYILVDKLRLKRATWISIISGVCLVTAVWMAYERIPAAG